MTKAYDMVIPGHPNVYENNERELPIYFNEPLQGINHETGILLLLKEFNMEVSSVEENKRRTFLANRYNMVTIQCECFGHRFMQGVHQPQFQFNMERLSQVFSEEHMLYIYDGNRVNLDKLFEVGANYDISLEGIELLNETMADFNDMGIMQAIDHLTALYAVMAVIEDNAMKINPNRICAYGRGHGGYLAHLCNAFAPHLFHTILDQDAWLIPDYLETKRMLSGTKGLLKYKVIFEYMANNVPYDKELLYLPSLYKLFQNQAKIVAFQNKDADGKLRSQKQLFFQSIEKSVYLELNQVSLQEPGNESVNTTENMSLEVMMDQALLNMENFNLLKERSLHFPIHRWETRAYRYTIDFNGLPLFNRSKKQGL